MSLSANIEHLYAASGIEAVTVVSPHNPRGFRGAESWAPVLDAAMSLFTKTGEPSVRLVVGTNTIVVQKENEETVAVVLPTGHAIAKSLRRMIRRMAKKDRGPLPKPAENVVSTPAAAPGSTGASPFTF